MEFTVFRSTNGFQRNAQWTGIFEFKGKNASEIRRKVFRKTFPFPESLTSRDQLLTTPWSFEGIEFSGTRYKGKILTTEGELHWDFDLELGHTIEFEPLAPLLKVQTLRTQIPIQGQWSLSSNKAENSDFSWSSRNSSARATLQFRDDSKRVWPTVWFHSQSLRDTSGGSEYCAEGLHAHPKLKLLPALTCISAFERLKGIPENSLWRALRSNMHKIAQGWSFRTEQEGRELRGKVEVEPKHWVTLRYEDIRGAAFYRTSTRMARMEVLVLDHGKPMGFFSTALDTWLEWTTFHRPVESSDLR
ncbi:MAG: hypothetical protein KGQ59_00200 [Bdellovibrionales bacterium]|nr:hypothetical protein [Bdellovibrionales bacterium]